MALQFETFHYEHDAASGVASFCGAVNGAPKISALDASTKCACGARRRTGLPSQG